MINNTSSYSPEQRARTSFISCSILIAAIFYNAFDAIINAHVTSLTQTHVMITESIIILCACILIVARFRHINAVKSYMLFFFVFFFLFYWVSIFNGSFYIKSLRDMLLLPIFLMIGALVEETSLIRTFRWLTMIIFAGMLLEMCFTDIYATIFQPAQYFANTRGIEQFSLDSSGLFRNSLGFKGRFSYGIFDTHRLSSIFLEQVSLANFSTMLSLFACSFWPRIKWRDRALYLITIIFILLTNNSRTASILNLIIFFGYFMFPLLPGRMNLLYMPLILLLAALFFYNPHADIETLGDNFQGRIGHTLNGLHNLDFKSAVFGNIASVETTADNGYMYMIYTQTLFGLIIFWIFSTLFIPVTDKSSKRFADGTAIFFATNFLIGAAIFTIKISAPLWIIAGYYHQQCALKETSDITDA